MSDRATPTERARPAAGDPADASLQLHLGMMIRALLASPVRNTLFLLGAATAAVIVATVYGQIRLNRWNQPFYDAVAHRAHDEFMVQLGVFGTIAGALLVLNVAQRWLGEMLKLKLREGLVRDLVELWLKPRQAFRLAHAGPMGVNPDQRMHEDARHLTELSVDLGTGLLQALILFIAFASVLWAVSRGFSLNLNGTKLPIPGYLLWASILYAGVASLLSYRVGRGLISRNADRYAREADLRFSLVRVNEHIDAISIAAGEGDEARRIEADLGAVLAATRRLVTGLTNLTWVTAGYGWLTLIVPVIAVAPLYFAGNLSFGGLMMAAGAFTQSQSSLRWFVDNFSTIADWRATLLRVAGFRSTLLSMETVHDVQDKIDFREGDADSVVLDHLEVATPEGCAKFKQPDVEVHVGEHVLIVGESGTGTTTLFRALAGLWAWGAGCIRLPKDGKILYLPRTTYLPPGTLREALAYPLPADRFSTDAYPTALTRLGLERLVPLLDQRQSWDRELSEDEQHSLAFARAVLHAPAWIIVNEVLESLSGTTRERVVDVLGREFRSAGLIHIGRDRAAGYAYSREWQMTGDPAARRLERGNVAAGRPTPAPA
jgi:vitamin B12/bleomycin/antimicrobial peptide transport system ATP-binding/permease protein